jgi:hypothetical protein
VRVDNCQKSELQKRIGKVRIYYLALTALFASVFGSVAQAQAGSTNDCTKLPVVSELLPKAKSVVYADYLYMRKAPVLGGGLLGTLGIGSTSYFSVLESWGKKISVVSKIDSNDVVNVAGISTLSKSEENKKFLIFVIKDEDYRNYYSVPREPKNFYDKALFPFPCGGIREANVEDLNKVREYFKK